MDTTIKTILQGLEDAIRAEIEGHHFYLMAARTTDDAQGRAVFEQLAQEELHHARFLRAQHRSFRKTGAADPSQQLGTPAELPGRSPIFSEDIRARIGEAHFEMTALSVGIQLELSSRRFYTDAATHADHPRVRHFFTELADWESSHYQALLTQQETLKADYWAAVGFAPF